MGPPVAVPGEVEAALVAVHHESWPRAVAVLARRYRDLDLAEEAVAEAYAAAVRRWPTDGVPQNPEAWRLLAAHRSRGGSALHGASLDT